MLKKEEVGTEEDGPETKKWARRTYPRDEKVNTRNILQGMKRWARGTYPMNEKVGTRNIFQRMKMWIQSTLHPGDEEVDMRNIRSRG